MESAQLRLKLRSLAQECDLDEIRFTNAQVFLPEGAFVGRQPENAVAGAKSIIVCAIYLGAFYLDLWRAPGAVRTSRLVLSGFYFDVVEPLAPLAEYLRQQGYQAAICDGFAEANSIPLKQAALRAGLGWQGKNTLIINEKYGSWLALGGIVTDADLAEDNILAKNRCGDCQRCQEACPVGGLATPGVIDRSHCLSDIMENEIAEEGLISKSPGYFLECDVCQEVCPWNQRHLTKPLVTPRGIAFAGKRAEMEKLFASSALQEMDEATYNAKVLPYLSGVDLPYERYRRNMSLARGKS